MGCFTFPLGLKRDEPKATKLLSIHSSDSALTDREVNRSASDLRSQNVSNTSSESSVRRNSFPSTSQRANNLRVFSFQELKSATKGFSRSVNIGEGGFGCVFKAALRSLEDPSKKIEVAIKQLGKRGLQGHREWVNEVNVLGIVEHQNLVKLLGYCADDDERGMQRLLVYEYMPNGSVEDHLSPRSQTTLSWPMRLKIAQDAARGLAYLHEQMDFQIIFRDFKSSNILLDEHWNAKLSDFGLARLGPEEGSTHVSTAVVGTLGYAAPEYIRTGRLTAKSDVWGYGVFLYELITGRRPLDKSRPKSEQNLLDWVKPYISDVRRFQLIIDPRLEGKYPIKSVHRLSLIANQCLDRRHRSRPKMSDILDSVNKVIEAFGELGSPRLIVRNLAVSKETSEEKQVKKRNMDAKSGENGWFARMLKRRILKAR